MYNTRPDPCREAQPQSTVLSPHGRSTPVTRPSTHALGAPYARVYRTVYVASPGRLRRGGAPPPGLDLRCPTLSCPPARPRTHGTPQRPVRGRLVVRCPAAAEPGSTHSHNYRNLFRAALVDRRRRISVSRRPGTRPWRCRPRRAVAPARSAARTRAGSAAPRSR